MDPFLPSPLKIMRPLDVSDNIRLMTEVMLSSIRPPMNPFIGDASGVASSLGVETERVCLLFLNVISTLFPVTSRLVSLDQIGRAHV